MFAPLAVTLAPCLLQSIAALSMDEDRPGARPTNAHEAVNTIVLISEDGYLEQRFSGALRSDERLRRYHFVRDLPPTTDSAEQIVVLDHRARDMAQRNAEIADVRAIVGAHGGIVSLALGPNVGPFDVISTIGNHSRDVIVTDFDAVPFLVRAELNDKSKTGAAMVALYALCRGLPAGTHFVPCEILGSGLRYSSAKELAALWDEDYGTIRRQLRPLGYDTDELVKLSIASLVAVELRTTTLSISSIVSFAGYSRLSKLEPLLLRVYNMSASMIRDDAGTSDVVDWLRSRLGAAHAAALERRKLTDVRRRETARRGKLKPRPIRPPYISD